VFWHVVVVVKEINIFKCLLVLDAGHLFLEPVFVSEKVALGCGEDTFRRFAPPPSPMPLCLSRFSTMQLVVIINFVDSVM
jgi:hypothetical protein